MGLYLEGDLTEFFLRYEFGGLIFGGAYKLLVISYTDYNVWAKHFID